MLRMKLLHFLCQIRFGVESLSLLRLQCVALSRGVLDLIPLLISLYERVVHVALNHLADINISCWGLSGLLPGRFVRLYE